MAILGLAGPWPESVDPLAQLPPISSGHCHAVTASVGSFRCHVTAPFVHNGNGVTVALAGRPRWGGMLAGNVSANPAKRVHAEYLTRGRQVLDNILGAFALAIVDQTAGRVLLAVDRMGVERMTWSVLGQMLAFGSSAERVARIPAIDAPVRVQALYDFLMMHMIPAPATVFAGVDKLRPATALLFERGRIEVFRYWVPNFAEQHGEPFEALKAELHAALDQAVRECEPDERTGAFLSGGLDSSTVAGKLARVGRGRARTFSIGFGVDAYDELAYADIANRHFDCRPVQYHVTAEDVVAAFPLIAQAYDEPFGNSSAVPTYFCALRAREHGVTHLLAGDGGDEIFGGNERYARQRVFERYQRIPGALRRGLLERLARFLPGEAGWSVLSKARSYIEQARIPLPERLESWNFIYREGATMLAPEFVAAIDMRAPFAVMQEVYAAAPCKSTLNKMLYYDWHFTLADCDLRKVQTMSALAGVRVSYPMLDARVIDLSNRVTPDQKMNGLELRSFYKQAMRDFLPREILDKTKHGFGLPFGVWLQTHKGLGELIYSHLADLKARKIVRAQFIDDLIARHRQADASYYGYALWDLSMLEAWLKAHAPAT